MLYDLPPGHLHRASVTTVNDMLQIKGIDEYISTTSTPEQYIISGLVYNKLEVPWFCTTLQASNTTSLLLQDLLNGTAVGVSDGSFFPEEEVGACGWIISSHDGQEWVEGGGILPGEKHSQSAYRSELGRQLGLIFFLHALTVPRDTYSITVACDGLSAFNKVGISKEYIKCNSTDVDIISITSALWQSSNFKALKVHIQGHKDSDESFGPLTLMETMNCWMDA